MDGRERVTHCSVAELEDGKGSMKGIDMAALLVIWVRVRDGLRIEAEWVSVSQTLAAVCS